MDCKEENCFLCYNLSKRHNTACITSGLPRKKAVEYHSYSDEVNFRKIII